MSKFMKQYTRLVLIVIMLVFITTTVANAAEQPMKIGQDDLIYFIMTDRFNDGDNSNNQDVNKKDLKSYHGGDFQGIIDKLDYIKDLGFTAIWISPVVENQVGGYHGYWATDFYKTNTHFGSMERLKELVQKAHEKNIKVIIDIVVNHTGQMHPWIQDSKYEKWFHEGGNITNFNDQQDLENGRLAGLPDLNQENPEVKKYLIDMAKWWIKETQIDGYRLDTVKHVPKSFWQEFASEIKKDYSDFYLIGEAFDGNVDYVGEYQKTGITGMADFPVYYAVKDVFSSLQPANRLADTITKSASYPDRFMMGTFIDNHDVSRFASKMSKFKDEKLKQALTFMMTYTGIPIMYYGTEIALDGGDDPDNRRDMDWNAKSPITEYVKKLANIRKTNTALTHGDIKVIKVEKDLLCYARKFQDNTVITLYNLSNNDKKAEVEIPSEYLNKNSQMLDLISSKEIKLNQNKLMLDMTSRQVNMFTLKERNSLANANIYLTVLGGLVAAFIVIAVLRRKNVKR